MVVYFLSLIMCDVFVLEGWLDGDGGFWFGCVLVLVLEIVGRILVLRCKVDIYRYLIFVYLKLLIVMCFDVVFDFRNLLYSVIVV